MPRIKGKYLRIIASALWSDASPALSRSWLRALGRSFRKITVLFYAKKFNSPSVSFIGVRFDLRLFIGRRKTHRSRRTYNEMEI